MALGSISVDGWIVRTWVSGVWQPSAVVSTRILRVTLAWWS